MEGRRRRPGDIEVGGRSPNTHPVHFPREKNRLTSYLPYGCRWGNVCQTFSVFFCSPLNRPAEDLPCNIPNTGQQLWQLHSCKPVLAGSTPNATTAAAIAFWRCSARAAVLLTTRAGALPSRAAIRRKPGPRRRMNRPRFWLDCSVLIGCRSRRRRLHALHPTIHRSAPLQRRIIGRGSSRPLRAGLKRSGHRWRTASIMLRSR